MLVFVIIYIFNKVYSSIKDLHVQSYYIYSTESRPIILHIISLGLSTSYMQITVMHLFIYTSYYIVDIDKHKSP